MKILNQFAGILKKALRAFDSGEYTRAYNLFERALEREFSENVRIRIKFNQVNCQYNVGNLMESALLLESLILEFPENPLSWYSTARFQAALENADIAIDYLQQTIKKFPRFGEGYLALADLLKKKQMNEEAAIILNRMLFVNKVQPARGVNTKDILAELAWIYYQRGSWEKSIMYLQQCKNMDSDENFLHYDLLARCYLKQNETLKAKECLDKYFLYDGMMFTDLLILYSRIHCRQGDIEEASYYFKKALFLDPGLELKGGEVLDLAPLSREMAHEKFYGHFRLMERSY